MVWLYAAGVAGIVGTMVSDIWFHIDYRVAANISLIYVASLTTIFHLLYALRSNWKANRVGKIFFVKTVFLPVMLWQIVLSTWWDTDYPFRQQIRFAIYSLMVIAYLAMVVALWNEQRADRKDPDREL